MELLKQQIDELLGCNHYYDIYGFAGECSSDLKTFREIKTRLDTGNLVISPLPTEHFYFLYAECISCMIEMVLEQFDEEDLSNVDELSTEKLNKLAASYRLLIRLKNEAFDAFDMVKSEYMDHLDAKEAQKQSIIRRIIQVPDFLGMNADVKGLCLEGLELGSETAAQRLIEMYLNKDVPDVEMAHLTLKKMLGFKLRMIPLDKEGEGSCFNSLNRRFLSVKSVFDVYLSYGNLAMAENLLNIMESFVRDNKNLYVIKCHEIIFGTIRPERYLDDHMQILIQSRNLFCERKIQIGRESRFDNSLFTFLSDPNKSQFLTKNEKSYIATSFKVFAFLESETLFLDYSAATMPAMKAVESILFRIMVLNYLPYLSRLNYKGELDVQEIPECFRCGKQRSRLRECDKTERLELGSALHCIGSCDDFFIPSNLFIGFLERNNVQKTMKVAKETYRMLKKILEKRNKSAHRCPVVRDDAIECKNYLFTQYKFIEFLIDNYGFCLQMN